MLTSDVDSSKMLFACSHQQSVKRSHADSLEDGRVKNSGHVWRIFICEFVSMLLLQIFSLSVFEKVRTQFFHVPNFWSSQWRNVKLYVQTQQCAWSRPVWDDQRHSCRMPLDREHDAGQKVIKNGYHVSKAFKSDDAAAWMWTWWRRFS